MLDSTLKTDWILQVADVAAQLKVDLSQVVVAARPDRELFGPSALGDFRRQVEDETQRARRINALRTSDTRLQRADPHYATRAGSNNAHFLLPRPSTDTTPREYAELSLRAGSDISAVGVYTWFHLSALQKASRLANESLAPAERQALARAMLADEGFALHFLEDTFAAGHVAGTWGDVSQRKGTHDYYNESGPRGLHLGRRQRIGGPDGRRAHAQRGHRAPPRRDPRQPRAGDRPRPADALAWRCCRTRPAPRPSPMPSTSARTTCCSPR
jgi:hypothetical protein